MSDRQPTSRPFMSVEVAIGLDLLATFTPATTLNDRMWTNTERRLIRAMLLGALDQVGDPDDPMDALTATQSVTRA